MTAAVVTGAFVVAAVGAFWTAACGLHLDRPRVCLKVGVIAGLPGQPCWRPFPTGDQQGKLVADHQPVALAAMEGRWHSGPCAELNLIGQPNVRSARLDNPIASRACSASSPTAPSAATCRASTNSPQDQWPHNIELLYYAFHIMVGPGHALHRAHGPGGPARCARGSC